MALTEVRKGEIALALMRAQAKKEGLRLQPERIRRSVGQLSGKTGIPVDELMEFGELIAQELMRESFHAK